MREARAWFGANFSPASAEEAMRIAPPATPDNAKVRMVISYWEMAASFVTAGILNQELFFESGSELLFVWERLRPIVPGMREMFKNPAFCHNMETVARAFIRHLETRSAETYPMFQAMVRGAAAGTDKP